MQTLGAFSQYLSWSFYLLIAVVVSLAVLRAKSLFFGRAERYSYGSLTQNKWLKTIKILYAICWILFLFGLPNALFITSTFRRVLPEHITLLLWISFMLLGVIELIGCLTISKSLINKKLKKTALIMLVLLLGYNAVKQLKVGTQLFNYPPFEESVILSLPLEGNWSAMEAGGTLLSNNHQKISAQRYAIDLIKLNEKGGFYIGEGIQLSDHMSYGADVYAPVDGKVIAVVDSLPNREISINPLVDPTPLGNYIEIQIESDRYLILANLGSGSILLREGEEIKAGDLVGKVGNSGGPKWPHLHLHIQDQPVIDSENALGIPIRFESLRRKRWFEWQEVTGSFLLRNDIVKPISD